MLSLLLMLACSAPDSSPAPVEAAECDCEGTGKGDSKADSPPVEEQLREIRYDCAGQAVYLAEVDVGLTMPPSALIQVWAHYSDFWVDWNKTDEYTLMGDYFGSWEQISVKMSPDGKVIVPCDYFVHSQTQEEIFIADYYIIYVR